MKTITRNIKMDSSVKALVDMGIYKSINHVIQDALIHLMEAHPEYKIELAIYRYRNEEISIGKAAEIAGTSIEKMKEILIKHGIRPLLGPESIQEAQKEVETLRRFMNERNHK